MAEKTKEAAKANTYDPDKVKECVDECEKIDDEKDELHMAYMGECSGLAKRKTAAIETAKKVHGIPKKHMKFVLQERLEDRKIAKIQGDREQAEKDMDTEEFESVEQIRSALGMLDGTPLGDAAVDGAPA